MFDTTERPKASPELVLVPLCDAQLVLNQAKVVGLVNAGMALALHELAGNGTVLRTPHDHDWLVFRTGSGILQQPKLLETIVTFINNIYPGEEISVFTEPRKEHLQFDNPIARWLHNGTLIEMMQLHCGDTCADNGSYRMPVCEEKILKTSQQLIINGQEFRVVHPAFIMMHKLLMGRDHDRTDLERLWALGTVGTPEFTDALIELSGSPEKAAQWYAQLEAVLCPSDEWKQVTKRWNEINHKHPIVARLAKEQTETHRPNKRPYHCLTAEVDALGRPQDHIRFVSYWALALAVLYELPEDQQEAIVIAGMLHDKEQGPGHEEVNAQSATEILSGYPPPFIDLVQACIRATKIIKEGESLVQKRPDALAAQCLADADLACGLGRPWERFIMTSMYARWEDLARKNIVPEEYDADYNVALKHVLPEMAVLMNLLQSNSCSHLPASSLFFPHVLVNTLRMGDVMERLEALAKQDPDATKSFAGWIAFCVENQ